MSRPASLYRDLLGAAWERLPPAVRAFHAEAGRRTYRGRARVEVGPGRRGRLAARLFGLPRPGLDVPVTVAVTLCRRGEIWRRSFAGRPFVSVQYAGRGDGLLFERVGPITVGSALALEGDRLRHTIRRWSLLGIPMPRVLAPGGAIVETEGAGRYRFDIALAHRWTGPIVRYRGWLAAEEEEDAR